MFYEPLKKNHGLSKNPFNSLVVPRPIGWISSIDKEGIVNLAPYSFFNAVCYRPPTVMFASGPGSGSDGMKDSISNIESTGEFVCNLATWETREQMNQTSASVSSGTDEMELTGLTPLKSNLVKVPRVAETPVNLECRYLKSIRVPSWEEKDRYFIVLGEVIGIHIRDEYITEDGLVDIGKINPIGRMGYNDYTSVNSSTIFTMERPD
jgi:flavin reductase (DIM6/NTAB) family NADH-FMN oxidoreductase RutF